jgi:hypothetical protein
VVEQRLEKLIPFGSSLSAKIEIIQKYCIDHNFIDEEPEDTEMDDSEMNLKAHETDEEDDVVDDKMDSPEAKQEKGIFSGKQFRFINKKFDDISRFQARMAKTLILVSNRYRVKLKFTSIKIFGFIGTWWTVC